VQRVGLILSGVVFVVLFVGVGLAVGIGSNANLPAGDVVIVEGAPPRLAEVTRAEFDQDMRQQAALAGLGSDFGPGDPGYEQLKKESLSLLISAVWMESEAIRRGVPVTSRQVDERLTPSEEKILREAHFTPKTMDERMRWMLAGDNILKELDESVPPPTRSEVRAYFEENPPEGESFGQAADQISQTIDERRQAEIFNDVEMDWRGEWQLRTHCADGYVVEECANYPIFDRNSTDPSACYEPDPKPPAEECPAPVEQPRPAQPGSVRWWHPEGERLVQRPVPPGTSAAEVPGG
jgi:hypothetical protein